MVEGEDRPPGKAGNYVVRQWRGELSLGVSFWVNGVLGFFLLVGIARCLPESTGVGSLKTAAAIGILFSMFSLIALLWQAVGIWRSAANHADRGRRQLWARLAKLIVAMACFARVDTIVHYTVPQAIEHLTILTGDKQIAPYEI